MTTERERERERAREVVALCSTSVISVPFGCVVCKAFVLVL